MDDLICSKGLESFVEIAPGAKLAVNNGKIKWHITSFTPDMDKYKVILAFEQAFKIWQKVFYPIEFEATSKRSEAQVILHFANNGESRLPIPFGQNVLAYAFAPTSGRSNVWFNDAFKWAEMHKDGQINLKKVTVHELGHSFNLGHSTDIADILYPRYQPNDKIVITQDTINGIHHIYKDAIGEPETPEDPEVPEEDPPVENPETPDETPIKDILKKLFPNKIRLSRLTEEQLIIIASLFDIEASIKDLKKDTIKKISEELYK